MKRRTFVILSSAAAVSVPVLYYFKKHKWKHYNPLIIPDFLSIVTDEKTIKSIGAAYIKQHPNEKTKNLLKKAVLATKDGNQFADTGEEALRNFISTKITDEFKSNNTIIADGWVLAQTEARQCALFSLTY